MANRSVELTLTRWHLVTERLNAKAKELVASAMLVLGHTQVLAYQGDEQLNSLVAKKTAALLNLEKARALFKVVGEIRAAVAKENAAVQVTQDLAKLASMNREIELLTNLLSIETDGKIAANFLESYFNDKNKGAVQSSYVRQAVAVEMLTFSDLEGFASQRAELQSRAHALSDLINTHNKRLLRLELEEDVAKIAGV